MKPLAWLLLAAALMVSAPAAAQKVTALWSARTTAGTSPVITTVRAEYIGAQVSVGTCTGDFDLIIEGFIGAWEPIAINGGSATITKATVAASTAKSWAVPPQYQKIRSTIAPGIANCSVSLFVSTR